MFLFLILFSSRSFHIFHTKIYEECLKYFKEHVGSRNVCDDTSISTREEYLGDFFYLSLVGA